MKIKHWIFISICIILLIIVSVFWNRFTGAYQVYAWTGQLQHALENGMSRVDMSMSVQWHEGDDTHRADLLLHHHRDGGDYLHLDWAGKQYEIQSASTITEVAHLRTEYVDHRQW